MKLGSYHSKESDITEIFHEIGLLQVITSRKYDWRQYKHEKSRLLELERLKSSLLENIKLNGSF